MPRLFIHSAKRAEFDATQTPARTLVDAMDAVTPGGGNPRSLGLARFLVCGVFGNV